MATTKRAAYRFVVKEGPTFMREVREGVLEPVSDPFITAEPCGTEPVHERLSAAVTDLKETLASQGLQGAIGSLEAVESVCANVIRGWSKAISMSQEILNKFGQGEDPDA